METQRLLEKKAPLKVLGLLSATLGPVVTFAVTGLLFVLCYHHLPRLVDTLLVLWATLCLTGALLSRYSKGSKEQSYSLLLCVLAVFTGSLVGGYNYSRGVAAYWAVDEHRHYNNVWPDELAEAHRDASAIVFAQGTKPDGRMPTAFTENHRRYCVAPITMKYAQVVTPEVQYWAAGVDCCTNDEFFCGDALLPGTRSGLVLTKKKDFFSGKQEMDFYMEAANMASAKFGVHTAAQPLFLHWVADIEAAKRGFLHSAWIFWLVSSVAALPIFLILAFAAASPGAKSEKRKSERLPL